MNRLILLILLLFNSTLVYSFSELKYTFNLDTKVSNKETIVLKVFTTKDKQLVVAKNNLLERSACSPLNKQKGRRQLIPIDSLTLEQLSQLSCMKNGNEIKIQALSMYLDKLKTNQIFLEFERMPFSTGQSFSNFEVGKSLDRLLRKHDLIGKAKILSPNLKFLKTLKGRVNKDHKTYYLSGKSRSELLHLALYYNLSGVFSHYQWIYDEDITSIKTNDKRSLELYLWGTPGRFIKDKIMKKNIDGFLNK